MVRLKSKKLFLQKFFVSLTLFFELFVFFIALQKILY